MRRLAEGRLLPADSASNVVNYVTIRMEMCAPSKFSFSTTNEETYEHVIGESGLILINFPTMSPSCELEFVNYDVY